MQLGKSRFNQEDHAFIQLRKNFYRESVEESKKTFGKLSQIILPARPS